MSKRNQVLYTKPDDPKFLQLIKQQIGYKEGPSIEAKRQKLEQFPDDDSDISDKEDEQPQVVVLKSGDLTATEVEKEKQRIEIENKEQKADLNQRVIFKVKSKKDPQEKEDNSVGASSRSNTSKPAKDKVSKGKPSKLSFDEDEFED